jgi:hypothetical protein
MGYSKRPSRPNPRSFHDDSGPLEQLQCASMCTPIVRVPDSLPVGPVIEETLLLDACSVESDWAAGVIYLPIG